MRLYYKARKRGLCSLEGICCIFVLVFIAMASRTRFYNPRLSLTCCMMEFPLGSNHFKLIAGAATLDFAKGVYVAKMAESDMLSPGNELITIDPLSLALPAASELPIFVVFGVEFYQQCNGVSQIMHDGGLKAVKIVLVDFKAAA